MANGRPIDEKIVQLTLENSDFENKARQSVKTFADMNESFTNMGKVDLSSVTDGIDSLNDKFSLTGTIVRKAYDAVATSVVGMGQKALGVANKLTFGSAIDGLNKYELKIKSIGTIMANTQNEFMNKKGMVDKEKQLATVTKRLNELNDYSDQTIYSFSDMTTSIGRFTAAGVKLKDSVTAIKGISNLAAQLGADNRKAASASMAISRVLSGGTMNAMTWRMLETNSMNGRVFQQALWDTAKSMGRVKGELDDLKKKGIQFRNSFSSKDYKNWLNDKVVLKTLKKFSISAEDVNKAEGKLQSARIKRRKAREALEESDTKANRKRLKEANEAVKKAEKNAKNIKSWYKNYGKTASQAATKVKTFSQLKEVFTEQVSTGWTKSWEFIIGDINQAKKLWTSIKDYLVEVDNALTGYRNQTLQVWSDLGGRKELLGALKSAWKVVEDIVRPIVKFFEGLAPSTEKAGENLYNATKVFEDITTSIHKITKPISDTISVFTKIAGEILGPVIATGIRVLVTGVTIFLHAIRPVSEVIGIVGEFIRILWDTGKALIMNFTPIGSIVTALSKKFDSFANAIKKPFDFISNVLHKVKEDLEKINPMNMLKDVSSQLKDGSMTIGGAFLYVINSVFKRIKSGINNLLNKLLLKKLIANTGLSGLVDKIKDFFNNLKKIKVFDTLTKAAMLLFGVVLLIGDTIKNAFQSQIVKDAVDRFRDLEKAISKAYKNGTLFVKIFKKIGLGNFIKKDADGKEYIDLLGTINSYLSDIKDHFTNVSNELKKIKNIFDEKGIQGVFDYITDWIKNTFTVDNFVKVIKGVGTAILSVGVIVASFGYDLAKKLLPQSVMDKIDEFRKGFTQNGFLDKVATTFEKVRKMLKDGKSVTDIFKSLGKSFESLFGGKKSGKKSSKGLLDVKTVLIGIGGVLAAIVILKKLLPKSTGILGSITSVFTKPFTSLTKGVDNAGKAAKAIGFGAKLAGVALVLFSFKQLAEGFKILADINFGVLRRRAELILVFLGVLGGITKIFGKSSKIAAMGIMLYGLGNALVKAAEALDMMSKIKDPGKAILIFGSVILAIVGLMAAAAFLKVSSAVSRLLLSIAISMMGIAVALRMFASMDTKAFDTAEHRLFAIFADIGLFMQFFRGMKISGIASTLLSLSISLIVLFGVIKLFSTMEWPDLLKDGGKVALVMVAIAGFFWLMSKSGNIKYFKGVAATILALSVSMYILGHALQLFSKINMDDLGRAALTLVGLVAATLIIATVISKIDPKGLVRIGSMMVMMAVSFAIFALAMAALSLIPDMTNGFIAMIEFIAFVGILSKAAESINKMNTAVMAAMMVVLAGAFVLFASGMKMLIGIPWETVTASLLGFTAVIAIFTLMAKGASGIGTNMFVLAAGMIVLSLAFISFAYGLQYLKDVDATAISAAMGGFIATMALFALLGPALNAASVGMLAFGGTMIMLAAAVYILAKAIEVMAPIIGPTLLAIGDMLMSGFKAIGDTVLPVLQGLWYGIAGTFNTIGKGINWFSSLFGKMFGGLSSSVDSETQKLQNSTERLNSINASANTGTAQPNTGATMQSMFSQLGGASSGEADKAAQKVKKDVDSAKTTSVDAIKSYGEDVSKTVTESKEKINTSVDGWVDGDKVKNMLAKFTDDTKGSFSSSSTDINETINSFTNSLGKDVDLSSLGGLTDKIDLSTKEIPDVVTKNVSSGSGKVKKASKKLAKDSKDAIKAEWKDLQLGKYLTKGCVKGLDSETVETKARGLAKKAIKAMKEELGVHSPSKVAERLFRYVAEGGALGLDHGSSDLISSARKMSSGALSEISALLDEDFATTFSPEVSPILDMDAMNGISSSLSGLNANVGLRAPNIQNGFGMSSGTEVNGLSVNVNITTTGHETPEEIARIARQSAQSVISDEVRKIVWR